MMKSFKGKWKILEMEQWDREYIDFAEPGFFEFKGDGTGDFVFGTVSGIMDARYEESGKTKRLEFSWEGTAEMDPVSGRGWFELSGENQLYGRLFIHNGDDSWVKVEKQ